MSKKSADADEDIPPGSAAALAAAIAQDRTKDDPVGSSRAELFLDEQTKLIRLQSRQLDEQRQLLLGSLRFRHLGEVMSVALQIILGVLGIAVVIAISAAVWSAAHDNGLVVETFDVPPDLAARGLTGKVVASQLLDHLASLQESTENTARASTSYKNNWGDDIKVQIPNTGISVGDFYRYLCEWLGSETHIGGDIYRTPGGIVLTVRTGSASGGSFQGSEADLPKLLQQAAEDVYRHTQPYRYSVYLSQHKRGADGEAVLQEMLRSGPESEFKWAYVGLANRATGKGDFAQAAAFAQNAVERDGNFAQAHFLLASIETARGHDEAARRAIDGGIEALRRGRNDDLNERAKTLIAATLQAQRDEVDGDFAAAVQENAAASRLPDYSGRAVSARIAHIADLALIHDVPAAQEALKNYSGDTDTPLFARAALIVAAQRGDRDAVNDAVGAKLGPFQMLLVQATADDPFKKYQAIECLLQPWAAAAAATPTEARTRIAGTPPDCALAQRIRGRLEAQAHNWNGAAYWFDTAIAQSPSLPFAYSDFGATLLAKGDIDGAIAKFAKAHALAPHFADPLELWGEALVARNRSDLALAEFDAASRTAPNWGRLHLKWSEALFYAGRRREAAAQLDTASRLFLTRAEQAELAADRRR